MRQICASFGGRHNARIIKTWRGTFARFVELLLSRVPETMDKTSNGWVCGAEFSNQYRDSENFIGRHWLTLDYDRIAQADLARLVDHFRSFAHLAHTTWSHCAERPRLRVWLPLSRVAGYDEFQAVSRRVGADAPGGVELAARESHTPAQYMFRPAVKPFDEIQVWKNLEAPWVDVDAVLATYGNWTDRASWPRRAEHDHPSNTEGGAQSPLEKPGLVGAFCRAYSISQAIQEFDLPYKEGSTPGRLTYTLGSRPDGAIIYDNDTKLHSHHDTDPAHGQVNAYDLVRLHKYSGLDQGTLAGLSALPSTRAMGALCAGLGNVKTEIIKAEGFTNLDDAETSWDDTGQARTDVERLRGQSGSVQDVPRLPARIERSTSPFSDIANARRIQAHHGKHLLSVGEAFYQWTGKCWEEEGGKQQATKLISSLSRIVQKERDKAAEAIAKKAEEEKREPTQEETDYLATFDRWRVNCEMTQRINACRTLLVDFLDFKAANFNRNPDLFNVANGTINLRTGELKPHDPKDFILGCAPTAYDPAAQCPRFERFLSEIYDGQEEIVAFVRRWLGYCLTGEVREHKAVFHIGIGRNGKGTLMRLMRAVLGPSYYGEGARTLLEGVKHGASPELADLFGRRMVTLSEPNNKGEAIDIKSFKYLTGGDPIKARWLHKNLIEFLPTHKLQIFTNEPPVILDTSFAVRERVVLLKYEITRGDPDAVAADKTGKMRLKDINLDDTLHQEHAGILRWLIEGAQEWYRTGLQTPASVKLAGDNYMDDEDTMATFVKERLESNPSARAALSGTVGALLPAYQAWCKAQGCYPLGRTRFQRELLRVMPEVRPTTWKEGNSKIVGFSGIELTGSVLDD